MAGSALASLIAGLLALPVVPVSAQQYPTKPIKLLVGVPPGGSTDAQTRMIGAWLQDKLGQSTVVENRPGANTSVAAHAVVQSPPDGHTLLVASDAYITVPLLAKVPYDPFKDLVPVALVTTSPFVWVVHPSTPINSIKELIAYAKANPGKLHFGTSGNGAASHLGGEKFKMVTGTDMVHVPYKGAGPALNDGIAGVYQVSLWTPLAAAPYVKSGKLRALAVTGSKRTLSLPDVPTFAEAGLPQYEHRSWLGVYAPAGTPKPVLDKLTEVIAGMAESPANKQKYDENGVEPLKATPEQFMQMMRKESEELEKLIKTANIKAD